jgi:glycosyltransferase involved in cell wall biosynthesis
MVEYHRSRDTWREKVDCFIALTDFARDKFVQAGFPADRIAVKPNFVNSESDVAGTGGGYALFVGRLSREKGVDVLLDAWEKLAGKIPLKIVGDGPLLSEIEKKAAHIPAVELLGRRTRSDVLSLMKEALVLVVPSICFEGFPVTIVEAYSVGLPVIASDLGSLSSLIDHGRTGRHFRPGDAQDLADQVEWVLAHSTETAGMRREARAEFDARYTAEKNYQELMVIYQKVIDKKKMTVSD